MSTEVRIPANQKAANRIMLQKLVNVLRPPGVGVNTIQRWILNFKYPRKNIQYANRAELPQHKVCARYYSTDYQTVEEGHKHAYYAAYLPQGELVLAYKDNLKIFGLDGKLENVIPGSEGSPWGLATSSRGLIGVTAGDRVKILERNGALMSEWGHDVFQWPSGIAVSHDGLVAVSDIHNAVNSVSLDSLYGHRLMTAPPSGQTNFFWNPRFIAMDQNLSIIVSDCYNHRIMVLDKHGELMFQFGYRGSEDGQLQYPKGVCLDLHGNIIVADSNNHRISLFSPQGHFVKQLVNAKNAKIVNPTSVAVGNQGQLTVTEFSLGYSAARTFYFSQEHVYESFKAVQVQP